MFAPLGGGARSSLARSGRSRAPSDAAPRRQTTLRFRGLNRGCSGNSRSREHRSRDPPRVRAPPPLRAPSSPSVDVAPLRRPLLAEDAARSPADGGQRLRLLPADPPRRAGRHRHGRASPTRLEVLELVRPLLEPTRLRRLSPGLGVGTLILLGILPLVNNLGWFTGPALERLLAIRSLESLRRLRRRAERAARRADRVRDT